MKKSVTFIVISLLVFGLMIPNVWAWDGQKHVKRSTNGQGDLIYIPFYAVFDGGWETKITVINTSNVYSTVAKVVFKSHVWTEELYDFLLYLSPNDVWTGYIRTDGATGAKVESTDDSILQPKISLPVTAAQFVSLANPFSDPIFAPRCKNGQSTWLKLPESQRYGYVEIIESRSTVLVKNNDGKVPKINIYNWYHAALEPTPEVAPSRNILTAFSEWGNSMSGIYAAMEADVFADWDNRAYLLATAVTGISGSVSRNSIGELEVAMAKEDIVLPYYKNFTVHILTFPTKMSAIESAINAAGICTYNAWDASPFFQSIGNLRQTFDLVYNSYDLTESRKLGDQSSTSGGQQPVKTVTAEVEMITSDDADIFPFNEGWVRYNFQSSWALKNVPRLRPGATPAINYYGAPVLASALFFKDRGLSSLKASFTDGEVLAADGLTLLPFYQTADGMGPDYNDNPPPAIVHPDYLHPYVY